MKTEQEVADAVCRDLPRTSMLRIAAKAGSAFALALLGWFGALVMWLTKTPPSLVSVCVYVACLTVLGAATTHGIRAFLSDKIASLTCAPEEE